MSALGNVEWGINSSPQNAYYYNAEGEPVWADDPEAVYDESEDGSYDQRNLLGMALDKAYEEAGDEGEQAVIDYLYSDIGDDEALDWVIGYLGGDLDDEEDEDWTDFAEDHSELAYMAQLTSNEAIEQYMTLPYETRQELVRDKAYRIIERDNPDIFIDRDKLADAVVENDQNLDKALLAYRKTARPYSLDDAAESLQDSARVMAWKPPQPNYHDSNMAKQSGLSAAFDSWSLG